MADYEWVVAEQVEPPGTERVEQIRRARPTPIAICVLTIVCWVAMSFAIGALGAWWWLWRQVEWLK